MDGCLNMTQLIQRLDATNPVAGWIDGTDAPTLIKDGIPYDRGALALDISSAISYYHMGLPFTANGRLAASIDVAVARIGNGAAPFTAVNRLAFSENSAVSYIGAIGFTADSMISLVASSLNSTAIFKVLLQNTLIPELATGSATPNFTRATTGSVVGFASDANTGASPIILTAASGEARFKGARRISEGVWSKYFADGAPINLANSNNADNCVDANGPFGYMAETAATNICLQSEDFTTTWLPQGATVDSNVAVAPDGTTTMDRLAVTAVDSIHNVYIATTSVANTTYVTSVYMKDDGAGFGGIYLGDGGGNNFIAVVANLTTGAITDTEVGVTSGTIVDSGVDDVGNGIYRVWLSGSVNTAAASFNIPFASDSGTPTYSTGRPTYLAVAGEDILIWGAQTELGTYPTSYIPTTTAVVTRNADVLIYVGAGNIEDPAGTAYAEPSTDWAAASDNRFVLERSNGFILFRSVGESPTAIKSYDGGNPASFSPTGTSYYKAPQAIASTWGAALTAYSPATLLPDPTPSNYDGTMGANNIGVGVRNSGATQWSGTIRNVQIYSTELTAAEVQDIP
jgi:hypothetical protein